MNHHGGHDAVGALASAAPALHAPPQALTETATMTHWAALTAHVFVAELV